MPPSLLDLLISKQIFKVGSNIKADLTRLRKQFPELSEKLNANTIIDLKEYCIVRGVIPRKGSGALDVLCDKVLGIYLDKPDYLRKHNNWETGNLSEELVNYAALDVHASRLIFEKVSECVPIQHPTINTAPGTRIVLLLQEGGDPIAYGQIAQSQPVSLGSVRVKTRSNNRVVVDIDVVLNPSAAVILHLQPNSGQGRRRQQSTKSGAFTLAELRCLAPNGSVPFQVVSPLSLLDFPKNLEVCIHTQTSLLLFVTMCIVNFIGKKCQFDGTS